MNPFKMVDELISRNYRIPTFRDIEFSPVTDDWEPQTLKNHTIDLGELLSVIKNAYLQLQTQNEELHRKVIDYECVLLDYSKRPVRTWTNGSSGYDSMRGWYGAISGETDDYEEARKILAKWSVTNETK